MGNGTDYPQLLDQFKFIAIVSKSCQQFDGMS